MSARKRDLPPPKDGSTWTAVDVVLTILAVVLDIWFAIWVIEKLSRIP